jgi:FkbM family methyltransferase
MGLPIDAEDALGENEEGYVKKQFELLIYRLEQLPATSRLKLLGLLSQTLLEQTVSVDTPLGPISFVVLGKLAGRRAFSLLTKQPETLEWIGAFQRDSIFWDIGANVGVYSLYAGLRGDTRVVAFEPAAVNYFLLAANCELNQMDARIDSLQLGVGGERGLRHLEVSQFAPGDSFSFRGKADRPRAGRQASLILSIDELVEGYGLPCPNYIKIDVPALSDDIVAGASRTLQNPELREVHIEINPESIRGRRIRGMFEAAGLELSKRHAHGGTMDVTFLRA